jgi:hypothetical protein
MAIENSAQKATTNTSQVLLCALALALDSVAAAHKKPKGIYPSQLLMTSKRSQ